MALTRCLDRSHISDQAESRRRAGLRQKGCDMPDVFPTNRERPWGKGPRAERPDILQSISYIAIIREILNQLDRTPEKIGYWNPHYPCVKRHARRPRGFQPIPYGTLAIIADGVGGQIDQKNHAGRKLNAWRHIDVTPDGWRRHAPAAETTSMGSCVR